MVSALGSVVAQRGVQLLPSRRGNSLQQCRQPARPARAAASSHYGDGAAHDAPEQPGAKFVKGVLAFSAAGMLSVAGVETVSWVAAPPPAPRLYHPSTPQPYALAC